MDKAIAALIVGFALSGCDDRRASELRDAQQKMPAGCELRSLGRVGDAELFVTFCRDYRTTTTSTTQRLVGKMVKHINASVVASPLPQQGGKGE